MNLFLSLIVTLTYVDMTLSKGNVGYCTLDQVKYGGTGQCSKGGTKIDFTPTPEGKDWTYYAGIVLNVGTVVAPRVGPAAVSYVNLFNNIGLKYGIKMEENDDISKLTSAISAKIDGEILTLKECLTKTILDEIGTLYNNEINGFVTKLSSVSKIHDKELHEEKLDGAYESMCTFAETNFFNAFKKDYHGLKYEILAPVFNTFIHNFVEVSKAYFPMKQAFCFDHDQKDPDKCKHEFNYYLQRAKTIMPKMQNWIKNGLQKVKTQIDAINILHKDCNKAVSYDTKHRNKFTYDEYDIIKLTFIDGYGESYPDVIDKDSDWVRTYVKMNDEGDKWCDLGNVWCDTYTTHDNHCCTMCISCYYEHPEKKCKDSLISKGCAKQSALKSEITTYWNGLQKKYINPVDGLIIQINKIEMTKTKAPTHAPSSSPTTKKPTAHPTSAPTPCSKIWKQCGGNNWSGSKCCDTGLVCNRQSEWYSQCVPPDQVWPENKK